MYVLDVKMSLMAIYHFNSCIIQRSQGRSVVAAVAYRRAAQVFDVRLNKTHNYSFKKGVVHSEISIHLHAPRWAKEIVKLHSHDKVKATENLWNKVEASEKRIDSQLAREIKFALPIELTLEQNIFLAREFIQDQLAGRGMIADWSVHDDKNNPHVHVLLTMREATPEGFGHKVRAWNSKNLLSTLREQWADYANYYLMLALHNVKIDHRSYKDQGIDLIPGIHLGKAVCDMHQRGIQTEIMQQAAVIGQENLQRIHKNPAALFGKLTAQSATFTTEQVSNALKQYLPKSNYTSSNSTSKTAKGILAESTLKVFDAVAEGLNGNDFLTATDLEGVLKSLHAHESVFSERTLALALEPFTNNAESFAKAYVQLLSSPELVTLGTGDDGRIRYTTQKMVDTENHLHFLVEKLRGEKQQRISARKIQAVLARYEKEENKTLSEEQRAAVKHLVAADSISCLVGRAGTGKSFSLGAAKAVWESQGLEVRGIALAAIAAGGLARDANFESQTIASFLHSVKSGYMTLHKKSVLVMDEAGMTDSVSMRDVLSIVEKAGAKLVLVGDAQQLQPVGPGAAFRVLAEQIGFVELEHVQRQRLEWQRQATQLLAAGKVEPALALYHQPPDKSQSCVHFEKDESTAMDKLISDWSAAHLPELAQSLIISFKRDDVKLLNEKARAVLVQRGELAPGHTVRAVDGAIFIAKNDRLLFLKNDKKLGIDNGDFGTIREVKFTESGKILSFAVQLDKHADKITTINPADYHHFSHGYAATIHKVQGITRDNVFGYFGNYNDKHSAYVQMSRHRERFQGYAAQTVHKDLAALTKSLNKYGLKDSVLDFPLAFAQRRNIEVNPATFHEKIKNRLGKIKARLVDQVEQILDPDGYTARCIAQAEEKLTHEQTQQQREDAKDVAAYVDANRQVGMQWQSLQERLVKLGIYTLSYDPTERTLVEATSEYKTAQAVLQKRDALAAHLIKNLALYTKAFGIYQLDIAKLQQQGQKHTERELVKTYQLLCKDSKTVLRDRLALRLQCEIKVYYPHLKAAAIDTSLLRQQALGHVRRQTLIGLNAQERAAFTVVEAYQTVTRALGAGYAPPTTKSDTLGKTPFRQRKTVSDRYTALKMGELTEQRGKLAQQILQDRVLYDKALDFYQIGLAVPQFDQLPGEKEKKQAEARWFKLQQAAARYEITHRVESYQAAVAANDTDTRLQLAHEIVASPSAHNWAIYKSPGIPQDTWKRIWRDERLHQQKIFLKSLDSVERIGFNTVAAYVDAKYKNAVVWKELFESKKLLNLDEKTFYSQLAGYAKQYQHERNVLASEILTNPSVHQKALDYFKLDLSKLEPQAHAHECKRNIETYLAEKNILKRSYLALKITEEPKAHYGFMLEHKITWKTLYKDARIAEQQQFFEQLNPEEKTLQRLLNRYQTAQRLAGKTFIKIKEQNKEKRSHLQSQKLDHLFAKRDYLAYTLLLNAQITLPDTDALTEWAKTQRLHLDKLQQHNHRHQQRIDSLKNWQGVQKVALTSAQQAVATPSNLHCIKQAQTALQQAKHVHQALRLEKSSIAYQYALKNAGLAPTALTLTAVLDKLQQHLAKLSQQITPNAESIQSSQKNTPPFIKSVTSPQQRVDMTALNDALNSRAREVALRYLGEPRRQDGKTLYYGDKKGSLIVTLSGKHTGKWKDWATGEGGSMLNLMQYALKTSDFKEVLQEARQFLGDSSLYQSQKPNKTAIAQDSLAEDRKRAQHVAAILKDAIPIPNTLADHYLRETREIKGEIHQDTFRFHPQLKNWVTQSSHPALLVLARDPENKVVGLQAIFLDSEGKKAALGHAAKLSRGAISGGAIVHQGKPGGIIALAEGPETALSVATAQPDWTVYTTYGVSNFASVALKSNASHIIICADNDGENSGTAKSVQATVKKLAEKDIYVEVVMPEKQDNQEKWDFNDALKTSGADNVRKLMDEAIEHDYPNNYLKIAYASFKKTVAAEKHLSIEQKIALAAERIAENAISQEIKSQDSEIDLDQDIE
jgi:ATP-dependent exoDNAse (exonuclease V) alpha subunit